MAAALLAGACVLAPGKVAQAQATCQGSLASSSPSAPSLAKFVPAATRSGVVFHAWLETTRTPSAGHLVLENTNPYPVAVRFDAELRGAAGSVASGSRCVWLRPGEFGEAVFEYAPGTLSSVRIGAAEVGRIESPAPRVAEGPAPARPAPRPRTRATETRAPVRTQASAPAARRAPAPARQRETAAPAPRRERVQPKQVARRDTAARSTSPRREAVATTARRETTPRVPSIRRDTTTRTPAPRRDTAVAAAPRRQNVAPTPRRETVPTASTARRDTAVRAPEPRAETVAAAPAPRRETAAPDSPSRATPAPRTSVAAADSPGAAATTPRLAERPVDTSAAVIAPRPAPDRSPVAAEVLERAAPGTGDTARSARLREDAPPLAKTGTTVFSLAFGALLVPAGIVLLLAIGAAAWLLIVGGLRRAWPWRRRD